MILRLELGWLRLVPCWFIFAFNRNWRFRPVSTLLPLILEDSILVLSGKRTSRSDPGHVSVAHWGSHAHAEHSIKSKIYQLGWFSLIGIICNTHQRAIWWIVVIVQPKPKPVSSWPKTKISEQLSWVGQHWTSFCGNCFNLNLWIPKKTINISWASSVFCDRWATMTPSLVSPSSVSKFSSPTVSLEMDPK